MEQDNKRKAKGDTPNRKRPKPAPSPSQGIVHTIVSGWLNPTPVAEKGTRKFGVHKDKDGKVDAVYAMYWKAGTQSNTIQEYLALKHQRDIEKKTEYEIKNAYDGAVILDSSSEGEPLSSEDRENLKNGLKDAVKALKLAKESLQLAAKNFKDLGGSKSEALEILGNGFN